MRTRNNGVSKEIDAVLGSVIAEEVLFGLHDFIAYSPSYMNQSIGCISSIFTGAGTNDKEGIREGCGNRLEFAACRQMVSLRVMKE
ncbi:hypothetical protein NDU88_001761 [Pleurodeles waltl]|uniref:Uncharacterized protein n=1 Tax=Pleurodeles waltl TaxID=8319 RepID=A0AAV7V994_PLEWA|nr:hypothetical protein NDU88_001761 [Pleurodeles waltl]